MQRLRSTILALACASPAVLAPTTGTAQQGLLTAAATALAPFKAGNKFFNVSGGALYVRDGQNNPSRTLLPAGSYSAVAPSHDGKYIAYQPVGSTEIRVRDVLTGRDLNDVLHSARIGAVPWTHNERGFFYTRTDTTEHRERVYYHALGRAETGDPIVLSQFDHPEWRYDTTVSDDGHYAVFTISHPVDDHTRIYFIDLDHPGKPNLSNPVVRLAESSDARYEFIDNSGVLFFLKTNHNAPKGQLLLADIDMSREDRWRPLIHEAGDSLAFVRTAGDNYIVTVYRTSTGDSAFVLGPPDPAKVREELRMRQDSLRKAQRTEAHDIGAPIARTKERITDPIPIRLQPYGSIAIPAGSRIVAMNSVADDEQLFYTVRLSDGQMESFMYNVKRGRSERYPTQVAAR